MRNLFSLDRFRDVLDSIELLDARVVNVKFNAVLFRHEADEPQGPEGIQDAACQQRRVVAQVVLRLAREIVRDDEVAERVLDVFHKEMSLIMLSVGDVAPNSCGDISLRTTNEKHISARLITILRQRGRLQVV